MRTSTAWVPAITVSLLYHAALLTLASKALSANNSNQRAVQPLSVQLLRPASTPGPMLHTPFSKPKPPTSATPGPQVAEPEPRAAGVETSTTTPTPPQDSMPATADNQQPTANIQALALESNPAVPNIQPLHRLTRLPAFLRQIEAVYPISERRAGIQANVLAEVTIDSQGNVLHVAIVKSGGAHFDKAVLEALNKSAFIPGYIDAMPVAVRFQVPFRFDLN